MNLNRLLICFSLMVGICHGAQQDESEKNRDSLVEMARRSRQQSAKNTVVQLITNEDLKEFTSQEVTACPSVRMTQVRSIEHHSNQTNKFFFPGISTAAGRDYLLFAEQNDSAMREMQLTFPVAPLNFDQTTISILNLDLDTSRSSRAASPGSSSIGAVSNNVFGSGPTSLVGSASLGWVNSKAQEGAASQINNFFSTVELDLNSSLFHPDFLSYRVRPRFSSGFQDARHFGTSPGSGIDISANFLPKRPWPVHFRYSRNNRNVLNSIQGLSLARVESAATDSILQFGAQMVHPDYPKLGFEFNRVTNAVTPASALIQGFNSNSRTLSLRGEHTWKGWTFNGIMGTAEIGNGIPGESKEEPKVTRIETDRNRVSLQAWRPLAEGLMLRFSFDRNNYTSRFGERKFSNTYEGFTGRLEFQKSRRLHIVTQMGVLRTGFDSYIESDELPAVNGPFTDRVLDKNAKLEIRYQLNPALSLVGRSDFTNINSEKGISKDGDHFSNSIGLNFRLSRSFADFFGSYFLSASRTNYTGQPTGAFLGHSGDIGLSIGNAQRLNLTGDFSFHRNRENIRTLRLSHSNGERFGLSLSRQLWGSWLFRIHGGRRSVRFNFPGQESNFRSTDYSLSLTGRLFSFYYSRMEGSGGGFYGTLDPTDPIEDDFLWFLGTSTKSNMIGTRIHLNPKIALRANWSENLQSTGYSGKTRWERQEVYFEWRIRQILVEYGYAFYRFEFGRPAFRRSWTVQITREFQIF